MLAIVGNVGKATLANSPLIPVIECPSNIFPTIRSGIKLFDFVTNRSAAARPFFSDDGNAKHAAAFALDRAPTDRAAARRNFSFKFFWHFQASCAQNPPCRVCVHFQFVSVRVKVFVIESDP